jgi:hypothetical protein
MAGLGIHISIQRFARANTRPPLSQLNLRNLGLPAAEIDDRLEYHANRIEEIDEGLREAFVLENYGANAIDIRGNENPTAASATARQTLENNYVLVTYNKGFS